MDIRLSDNHENYLIGDQEYPRLTHVIDTVFPKVWKDQWEKKVGPVQSEQIMREAAEFGNRVHLVTELNDLNEHDGVDNLLSLYPDLQPYLEAWVSWSSKWVEEWVLIEEIVWSKKYRVAGTLDRVGVIAGDKSPSIIDIKTGSLSDGVGIQLHGYKVMVKESKKIRARRCLAVNLPRTRPGKIFINEYDKPEYEQQFKDCCEQYYQMTK